MPAFCPLNRREFLATLACGLGAVALPHHGLFAAVPVKSIKQVLVVGARRQARMINLTQGLCTTIRLKFNPHSFIQHPLNPVRFIAIEKWGPGAAEIDFADRKVVRELNCPEHHIYQGHGYYMPEKNVFFITRTDTRDGMGHVAGFEDATHKPVAVHQVTPGSLHECAFLSDETLLVCSTGVRTTPGMPVRTGERIALSALLRINVHTGKILDERTIDDPVQMLGHLAVTRTDGVVTLSSPLPTKEQQAVMIATAKKTDQPYEPPRDNGQRGEMFFSPDAKTALKRIDWDGKDKLGFKGEMLSVGLNDSHTEAAVTNPGGNQVILLDAKTGAYKRHHTVKAYGVAYDKASGMFVGNDERLFRIKGDFSSFTVLDIARRDGKPALRFSGAHSKMVGIEKKT